MSTQSVRFAAPGGPSLEGRLALPEGARGAAVLCHPHPLYSGSMSSILIPGIQRALEAAGWASLRFNFRGVGRSEGTFDHGAGETADAAAALDEVARVAPGVPLAVAGWSFGSLVGLAAAARDERVVAYAGIAPPVTSSASLDLPPLPSTERLRTWGARALLTCGTDDAFCRPDDLRRWAKDITASAQVRVFEGADHFFSNARAELAAAVAGFFAEA